VPDPKMEPGRTVVIGERELAIGFRLIGLKDVQEITPDTAQATFLKLLADSEINLIIASQSVRDGLTEPQRLHAEASLRPLVVFVPPPSGGYEVESVEMLAKRILGVSLKVPN
jgi:V/A-type H+-transporting ATPase subunit F